MQAFFKSRENARKQKIRHYDPDATGLTGQGIFGLPFTADESELVFIPVPCDITVSYHEGTAEAPDLILEHSPQIDLFDPVAPDAWKQGMALDALRPEIRDINQRARETARRYIDFLEAGGKPEDNTEMQAIVHQVNQAQDLIKSFVRHRSLELISAGQKAFVVGGDHSTPLGLIEALAVLKEPFGILQIDAHADLRKAYQGFTQSHASIMYNALGLPEIQKVVQVGIREYCSEEVRLMQEQHKRIQWFTDRDIHHRLFSGESWQNICRDIVSGLPQRVYVSFDIDGLDPSLCPHTGTPVPGGLSYHQAIYILETLVQSGREIIGADLVETGPHPLDAIIACRLMYRMAVLMTATS